jgi:hypothetical protein
MISTSLILFSVHHFVSVHLTVYEYVTLAGSTRLSMLSGGWLLVLTLADMIFQQTMLAHLGIIIHITIYMIAIEEELKMKMCPEVSVMRVG